MQIIKKCVNNSARNGRNVITSTHVQKVNTYDTVMINTAENSQLDNAALEKKPLSA